MTLQTEQVLVRQLLDSPRLPHYLQVMEGVLADETRKREDFYRQISEGDKAEFIIGNIILHSPVTLRHNATGKRFLMLLNMYVELHGLGYVGYEKIMISLTRNDYEPDVCFFGSDKADLFTPDQIRFPAPDFVAEVLSESTEDTDRGIKFDDYAAHGVGEYWIIDPTLETIEQYMLHGDHYELIVKAKTGVLESHSIPGFQIPTRAIFGDEENRAALGALLAGR